MTFIAEYGLFLAKAATVIVSVAIIVGIIGTLAQRRRAPGEGHLEIKDMNREYRNMEATFDAVLDKKQRKRKRKERKKWEKARHNAVTVDSTDTPDTAAATETPADTTDTDTAADTADAADGKDRGKTRRKRIFLLKFHGDIQASAVAALRQEVSALLTVADSTDEVVVTIESGGGVVHGYGLGASQLARLKNHNIPLTVVVDKVAASGGYLMACVADRIIAAPFAIIGSIGVLAQVPNLHRLLKKHDIDFEQFTAGEFKRTVTLFGETTQKMRDKMQRDVDDVHQLFKDFVLCQRPSLDIDRVSTGEYWPALKALKLGLVDEVRTSDDYLMSRRGEADIYGVKWVLKRSLGERLQSPLTTWLRRGGNVVQEDGAAPQYPTMHG